MAYNPTRTYTRRCACVCVHECVSCAVVHMCVKYSTQYTLKQWTHYTLCAPPKLLLPFNGMEWNGLFYSQVILFPFNNISLSVHDPIVTHSRSMRIFSDRFESVFKIGMLLPKRANTRGVGMHNMKKSIYLCKPTPPSQSHRFHPHLPPANHTHYLHL